MFVAKVSFKSRFPEASANGRRIVEELLDESAPRVEQKWKGRVRADKGEFRDSIHAVRVDKLKREVRSNATHGLANELGTSRMAAQPDARRTVEEEPREVVRSARRKKLL